MYRVPAGVDLFPGAPSLCADIPAQTLNFRIYAPDERTLYEQRLKDVLTAVTGKPNRHKLKEVNKYEDILRVAQAQRNAGLCYWGLNDEMRSVTAFKSLTKIWTVYTDSLELSAKVSGGFTVRQAILHNASAAHQLQGRCLSHFGKREEAVEAYRASLTAAESCAGPRSLLAYNAILQLCHGLAATERLDELPALVARLQRMRTANPEIIEPFEVKKVVEEDADGAADGDPQAASGRLAAQTPRRASQPDGGGAADANDEQRRVQREIDALPFPRALARARQFRKWNRAALGKRCHAAADDVKRWESGDAIPSSGMRKKLRSALRMRLPAPQQHKRRLDPAAANFEFMPHQQHLPHEHGAAEVVHAPDEWDQDSSEGEGHVEGHGEGLLAYYMTQ